MMPETAPNKGSMVQCIEKWEREVRELGETTGEPRLSDAMQQTALQKIISVSGGTLATSVKKREFKAYREMREYVMKYAMTLRAEQDDKRKLCEACKSND